MRVDREHRAAAGDSPRRAACVRHPRACVATCAFLLSVMLGATSCGRDPVQEAPVVSSGDLGALSTEALVRTLSGGGSARLVGDALAGRPDENIPRMLVEACLAGKVEVASFAEVLRLLATHPSTTILQLREAFVASSIFAPRDLLPTLADHLVVGFEDAQRSDWIWELARAVDALPHPPAWDALLYAWARLAPADYVRRVGGSLDALLAATDSLEDPATWSAADALSRHLATIAGNDTLPEAVRREVWSMGARWASASDAPALARARGSLLLSAERKHLRSQANRRSWASLTAAKESPRGRVRLPLNAELAATGRHPAEGEDLQLRIWVAVHAQPADEADYDRLLAASAKLRSGAWHAYPRTLGDLGSWEASQGDLPPLEMPQGGQPQFEWEIREAGRSDPLVPRQIWWPYEGLNLEYWNWTNWRWLE